MVSELKAAIDMAKTLSVAFFEGYNQGTELMQLDWELDINFEYTKPLALYCLSFG